MDDNTKAAVVALENAIAKTDDEDKIKKYTQKIAEIASTDIYDPFVLLLTGKVTLDN